jgi:hypothetical protein
MVKSYHKNNIAIARNFRHNPANNNPSPPSDCDTDSESDWDAYREGMGTTDAQKQVKQFSSKKYKSHRHIPENVTHTFDG